MTTLLPATRNHAPRKETHMVILKQYHDYEIGDKITLFEFRDYFLVQHTDGLTAHMTEYRVPNHKDANTLFKTTVSKLNTTKGEPKL